MIYKIFANLPDLVDFQRRFLISMETTLSLPQMDQRIGALFINNASIVFFSKCSLYLMLKIVAHQNVIGSVIVI